MKTKIQNPIHWLIHFLPGCWRVGVLPRRTPAPLPEQLDLGFDQITSARLPVRDALAVRSAEYWLQWGEAELALQELQSLPESVRSHEWPRRVQHTALHAIPVGSCANTSAARRPW